ncbi:MAG: DUF4037 domain-containing protein [Chloroflexota bacterium]
MTNAQSPQFALAQRLAARFGELPQVEAVALTGSLGMGVADAHSDIDLYVFVQADIPVSDRLAVATPYVAGDAEFNNQFWGTADSWHDLATGIRVEGLYWWVSFIEGETDRVLRRHEASVGYSTAFWHSIQKGSILFDRSDWLHQLQAEARQPYPEELRRAIVAKNHPILRRMSSSYLQQIAIAVQREDFVSVNHRTAALLASYFDILFALNRVAHPGEKRLVRYAEMLCEKRPPRLREQITTLVSSATAPDVVAQINTLLDGLDALLIAEGFDPART